MCLFDKNSDSFLRILQRIEQIRVDFTFGFLVDRKHGYSITGLPIRNSRVQIKFIHPIFPPERFPHILIVQLHCHFAIVIIGNTRFLIVVGLVGSYTVGFLLYFVLSDAAVVGERTCAAFLVDGKFFDIPSVLVLRQDMIELIEFVEHFFYFLLEVLLLRAGKICFQFEVGSCQWREFLLQELFLHQFRDMFGEEDQLVPVITSIFKRQGGLDQLESTVELPFLQGEHGFQKNSLFIVITVIDGSIHGLVPVGEATYQSQNTGQGKGQLGEGFLRIAAAYVQGEQVEVGGVVEVVQLQAGLQIGQGELQLAVVEVRNGSVGVEGGSGRFQQDDIVKQGQADGVVALAIHVSGLLEEAFGQLLDHWLREIIIYLYTAFQAIPSFRLFLNSPPFQINTFSCFGDQEPFSVFFTVGDQHSINLQPPDNSSLSRNQLITSLPSVLNQKNPILSNYLLSPSIL